jgi:hypothetical protein
MMQDIDIPTPTTLSGFAMLTAHHICAGEGKEISKRPADIRLLFDNRNISVLEAVEIITSSMKIAPFAWSQRLTEWHSAVASHFLSDSSGRFDDYTCEQISLFLYLSKCLPSVSEIPWWVSKIEEMLQRSSNKYIDTLLRTAALMCAGIESSALVWCETNLTPILVEFEEKWVLALAFNHVVEEYKRGECEFFLVNVSLSTVLLAQETHHPELYSRCIFPFVRRDKNVLVE